MMLGLISVVFRRALGNGSSETSAKLRKNWCYKIHLQKCLEHFFRLRGSFFSWIGFFFRPFGLTFKFCPFWMKQRSRGFIGNSCSAILENWQENVAIKVCLSPNPLGKTDFDRKLVSFNLHSRRMKNWKRKA